MNDPRKMTVEELNALGHEKRNPIAVIRDKCLDCCVYQANEVARCEITDCVLWPYRMNTNPFRVVSEAQRESGRRLAKNNQPSVSKV